MGLEYFYRNCWKKILFDLGASDLLLRNAARLNIDLMDLNYLILSHGHYDHTWGLDDWLKKRAGIPGKIENKPVLLAHPAVLQPKFRDNLTEFGMLTSKITLQSYFYPIFSNEPVPITEKLIFLGQIQRQFAFENQRPLGKTLEPDGSLADDFIIDDTALAYQTTEGLIIITGCSHSGICNIIEHARRICNEPRVVDIIGGFHLFGLKNNDRQLEKTLAYFKELNSGQIHPCHCTDLKTKIALAQVSKVDEVSVGLTVKY